MENIFYIFLSFPIIGYCISVLIPAYNEKLISNVVINMSVLSMALWVLMVVYWLQSGESYIMSKDFMLYESEHYSYVLTFLFDKVTAVYLGMTTFLTYLITKYSRYYLHKEEGYKRFFASISLFILSIYIITLSGNFETLFLGWEILGVSSYLLIAYYRDRYLPVRNAFRVYTFYKVADAGLLLAMWLSHHLWHHNVKFIELNNAARLDELWSAHSIEMGIVALFIGLAAAVKSAQFPFSTWLARAMEGPTPSSAIFYGSIAVNIGVYLMLRTYPFWAGSWEIKSFFILISLISIIAATIMGKTQSSVKAQIAYGSIVQIGIIFIEIVLGLHVLALIHFVGNAFLRAYQLLISPSVVTYLMREQFFNYVPQTFATDPLKGKWRNSLLMAGIKEFRIDSRMYNYLWRPLKTIGKITSKLPMYVGFVVTIIASLGLYFILHEERVFNVQLHHSLAALFGTFGVLFATGGLYEKDNYIKAWWWLIFAHVWIALAIGANETFILEDSVFYLSGVFISGLVGLIIFYRIHKYYSYVDLNDYHGLIQREPIMGIIFFASVITMAGFPLSTTFIGEDLLFTHINDDQVYIAFITILIYIVEGIALIRLFTRIFFGPNKSNQQIFARRFS